ncbi:MAG: DUF4123 domain-containing protein [Pseudomonadota bacterium]
MQARLTTLTGPTEGSCLELAPGSQAFVGRLASTNHLVVPDKHLAPTQFALECGAASCMVRDVSAPPKKHAHCELAGCFLLGLRNAPCSAKLCLVNDLSAFGGVYVNGKKVTQAELRHGDSLTAGGTAFLFEMGELAPAAERAAPPRPPLALSAAQHANALAFLAAQQQSIYAVVDAARSSAVLSELVCHGELYYSLYDGPEGEELADVAPYLVALPAQSALLSALLRDHWGDSRFMLLFAAADFKAVRRQLRRFLMVEDEAGKQMYFRFYDPRVLRTFLPTCTPAECSDFFGPISWFVLETEQAGLAEGFSYTNGSTLRTETVQF